jgi:3-methyladenine DNA glycosylase Mpg
MIQKTAGQIIQPGSFSVRKVEGQERLENRKGKAGLAEGRGTLTKLMEIKNKNKDKVILKLCSSLFFVDFVGKKTGGLLVVTG